MHSEEDGPRPARLGALRCTGMGLTAAQAAEIIDATPNAVYRLVAKGALAKPVKHQHGGLQLEDVEAASLQRYRPGRGHPYWCRSREAAEILGISTTRVQQLTVEGRLPYVEHRGRASTGGPSSR